MLVQLEQLSGIKRPSSPPERLCRIYPKKNPLQYYQERERVRVVQQKSEAIITAVSTIFHLAKQERPLSHYEAEIIWREGFLRSWWIFINLFEAEIRFELSFRYPSPNLDDNIFSQLLNTICFLDSFGPEKSFSRTRKIHELSRDAITDQHCNCFSFHGFSNPDDTIVAFPDLSNQHSWCRAAHSEFSVRDYKIQTLLRTCSSINYRRQWGFPAHVQWNIHA